MDQQYATNRAKSLLKHYLKFGLESSGMRWDGDCSSEVDDIVDSIVDACTPSTPAQPEPLARIADALERIANQLDLLCATGTDYNGNDMAVLQVSTLR